MLISCVSWSLQSSTRCSVLRGVQFYAVFSSTRCSVLRGVQSYAVFSSTRCSVLRGVQFYAVSVLRGVQFYAVFSPTRCSVLRGVQSYAVFSSTRCSVLRGVQSYAVFSSTRCSVLLQKGVPFNKPFARPPPTNNTDTEDELRDLSKFVMHLISNTKVKYNLSHDQAVGLKSLLRKRDTYHFSVSDKGGEFVVMDKEKQRLLTEYHIRTSTGVYRYIPPTRTYSGVPRDIAAPTEVSFNRQIKSRTELLETQCNTLWKTICDRRNVPIDLRDMFLSRHTNLPTLYVLIKTHKFSIEDVIIPDNIQTKCKVRPIVSCCSSRTEKLAWLCTEILSPLLNRVPSHLNNIYAHLDIFAIFAT